MLRMSRKWNALRGALTALVLFGGLFGLTQTPVEAQPGGQGTTRHKVIGNIFVDIAGGTYPAGYAPAWDLGQNLTYIEMAFEDRVVANQLSATDRMNFTIGDSSGEAFIAFESGIGQLCVASITGNTAPLVLGPQGRTFKLTNFHINNQPGAKCARMSDYVQDWQGEIALAAAPDGTIIMGVLLKAFSNRGQHTYSWGVSNYQFPNKMTPAGAYADIAAKKAAAVAAAQRAADQQRAAADARAAQDALDLRAANEIDRLEGLYGTRPISGEPFRVGIVNESIVEILALDTVTVYRTVINGRTATPECTILKEDKSRYMVLTPMLAGDEFRIRPSSKCGRPVRIMVYTNRGVGDFVIE